MSKHPKRVKRLFWECAITARSLLTILCSVSAQTSPRRSTRSQRDRSLTTREIAQKAYASTVVIYTYDQRGDELAEGSGFFVSPNVVATSYHVVKDADDIKASMILYPSIRFGAKGSSF